MKKITAIMLALLMVVSIIPMSALAGVNLPSSMTVVSDKEYILAPGVVQNKLVAFDADGNRVQMYVATADMNVESVGVYANYKDNQNETFGMANLSSQVAAAEANHADESYTVVAAMNASYYNMTTGQPLGAFVMQGNDATLNGDNYPFFAVLKDGSVMIGATGEYSTYKDQLQEAIGGNVHLVKDGAICSGLGTSKYSRSTIGVTADNKVIFMNADNCSPYSFGLTFQEQAEVMYSLGCVEAIELDGGGSATYGSREPGSDSFEIVNMPTDGAEREISNSVMIVSTAVSDGILSNAVLTAENEYVTPDSSVNISVIGADSAGETVEIPEDVSWQLVDASMGTVEDGVFTSNGTVGDAVVQMVYDEKIVGETTVHVVIPDIAFVEDSMTVPYSKTFTLEVVATTNSGVNEVALKEGDVEFALSDAAMGTVVGSAYTTCDESSGLTGGTITATLKYDSSKIDSVEVVFGKAAEIIYDFENGDINGFDIYSKYKTTARPIGRTEIGDLEIVDDETGLVRNGEKSLAVNGTMSLCSNAGWRALVLDFPEQIDISEATTIGAWVYIPIDVCDSMRLAFRDSAGKYAYGFAVNSVGTSSSPYQEDGWYYISVSASSLTTTLLKGMGFEFCDNNTNDGRYNPFPDFNIYVDDITLDFSSATEDREVPTFSKMYISENADSNIEITGQTITESTIDISAIASEDETGNYTGLDTTSAKLYVDGVKSDASITCTDAGKILATDVNLSTGTHILRFEISDKAGNMACIERELTINDEKGSVALVARDPDATLIACGSVQWFDLVAENIEKVQSISTVIDLDGMSSWELDNIETTYGFEAEYKELNNNKAEITITKTGEVEVSGEQIVASIPVRAWAPESHLYQPFIDLDLVRDDPAYQDKYFALTPYAMWYSDGAYLIKLILNVESGLVVFTDETTDTFATNDIEIMTEMNRYRASQYVDETGAFIAVDSVTVRQGKRSTHIHTEGEVQSKAATCTEAGYTDRTFCTACACEGVSNGLEECDYHSGCGSVVDWGTIVPATGHTYEVEDGVLKCKDCDKLFNGELDGKTYVDGIALDGWVGDKYYKDGAMLTGVKAVDGVYYNFGEDGNSKGVYTGDFTGEDGKHYYAKLGALVGGWFAINDEWYYFDETTFAGVSGEYVYSKFSYITYNFDEDGKLTEGVWYHDGTGYRYYYGPDYYKNGFQTIDGKTYAFLDNVRLEGGIYRIKYSQSAEGWQLAKFDENGVYLGDVQGEGLVDCVNGLYYYVDGKPQSGLAKVDGNYYYFNNIDLKAVKDCKYKVSNRNEITDLPYGEYEFDSEGKLIHKNGVYVSGSNYYYYENSKKTNAGLVKVGDDYYYSKDNGLIAVSGTYTVTKTSCDLPAGEKYKFGADGKMLDGLVDEGKYTFYYENGKRVKAGIVEIDGDYYYIDDNCLPKRSGTYTVKKSTVAEVPVGAKCKFDADGKMYNGVYEEGTAGNRYYYEFGKRVEAGVVEVDGEYYYARTGGLCAKNGTFTVTKSSVAGVEVGDKCRVHEDARVYNGIEDVNGNLYYYSVGKRVAAGLVKVDGDYYFTKDGGLVAVNGTFTVDTTSCDLPAGEKYKFGADGKMLQGVVAEGTAGNSYYYVNGKRVAAGLVEFDGNIYYAKDGGLVAKNGSYKVTASTVEGLETGVNYKFDADGKAYQGLVDEGQNTYYYENGRRVYAGLVKVDGDYYCVNKSGIVIKGEESAPAITSCDLPAGVGIKYSFGADGKMLQGIVDGYYYKNGQLTYAGLVQIGEDYYYIGKDFKPVCGKSQFAIITNCDLAGGETYTFDADGKLVK